MKFPPRLLTFANRGASAHASENTLPAFELAANMGADGIEFDVQISAAGQLIVHHDRELGRTKPATGPVQDWRFEDLRALDVGACFDNRFAGTHMPTPEEVVETAGDRLLATCPAEPDFLSAVWEQSLGTNSATHQIRMRDTISHIPHAV